MNYNVIKKNGEDYGIFPAPMNAQVALNELCKYLLGDDWVCVNSISAEQVNAEIVHEIKNKFKGIDRRK